MPPRRSKNSNRQSLPILELPLPTPPPDGAAWSREVSAPVEVTLGPGDQLVVPDGFPLRFQAGRSIPGAPRSGPDWAEPGLGPGGWRALAGLAVTLLIGGLGLTAAHSPILTACENWVWTVAFAYTQLLLARTLVRPEAYPWEPHARRDPACPLTPGQVQHAWAIFSRGLGTPAAAPRPSGKAPGRAAGFHPQPRLACPVISKKAQKAAAVTA